MKDHTQIEELLSLRALGAIEPQDEALLRAEMADHHQPCEECRRLEREISEVAGRLPFALDPIPIDRDLEDDTVAKALAVRPAAVAAGTATGGGDTPSRRWIRALVAVAAAIALFVGGWVAGSIGRGRPADVGAQISTFHGTPGINLALVHASPERGAYLVGSDLPPAPAGKTYALWFFHGATPVSAGCFEPTTQGTITALVDASLTGAGSAAVTLEPTACPSAPTSAPILTANL
jgi:hypothetical protein